MSTAVNAVASGITVRATENRLDHGDLFVLFAEAQTISKL